jgi:hypothetical protein
MFCKPTYPVRLPDKDNGYTGGLRAQAPAPWPHRRGFVFVHRRKRIQMIESLRDSGFCVCNYQSLQPTLFGRIEVMMRFGGRDFTVGWGFAQDAIFQENNLSTGFPTGRRTRPVTTVHPTNDFTTPLACFSARRIGKMYPASCAAIRRIRLAAACSAVRVFPRETSATINRLATGSRMYSASCS